MPQEKNKKKENKNKTTKSAQALQNLPHCKTIIQQKMPLLIITINGKSTTKMTFLATSSRVLYI